MNILIKFIRKILKHIGYKQISYFFQNLFRTRYQTDMYISQVNVVSNIHQKTFGEYRNKYYGKEIVIIATGPSLNKYKPITNVINIGVNKAIFYKEIKLDYYFSFDYTVVKSYLRELKNYQEIKKFYGILAKHPFGYREENSSSAIIPESIIMEQNASKFFIYEKRPKHDQPFNVDIDSTWLVGDSCIFPAVQFALFTNPKKIYLVGCDCSTGHFDTKNKKIQPNKQLLKTWMDFKAFKETYYPDTEVISINPVGLKGVFTDLYQEDIK